MFHNLRRAFECSTLHCDGKSMDEDVLCRYVRTSQQCLDQVLMPEICWESLLLLLQILKLDWSKDERPWDLFLQDLNVVLRIEDIIVLWLLRSQYGGK